MGPGSILKQWFWVCLHLNAYSSKKNVTHSQISVFVVDVHSLALYYLNLNMIWCLLLGGSKWTMRRGHLGLRVLEFLTYSASSPWAKRGPLPASLWPFERFVVRLVSPLVSYDCCQEQQHSLKRFHSGSLTRGPLQESNWQASSQIEKVHCFRSFLSFVFKWIKVEKTRKSASF